MFSRNFVKQSATIVNPTMWNMFRTMSTYAQNINLYNDDNTMNARNLKLYKMCQKIAKDNLNYVIYRENGEFHKLSEEEMTQLILCCSNDNWKSFNYFKEDNIKEANDLLKDFKFVCKMVIQDYRSAKYVIDNFKDDAIAMNHLRRLNKNLDTVKI